ncbi:MAG: hypothetical protein U1F83_01535 [Verrucomicrobiota bacterium]
MVHIPSSPGWNTTNSVTQLSPKLHMQMSDKRRKKLQALGATLPTPKAYGPNECNILLVGWGSTQGLIKEVVSAPGPRATVFRRCTSKHLNCYCRRD